MNWLICILLSLSPFIYMPSLYEFANLPQTVFIQTVIIVIFLLRLVLILRNRSFLCSPLSPLLFLPIVYFVWIWLSLLWAHNRYEGFLFDCHMFLCALIPFILAGDPVSSKWKRKWMLSLLLSCAGVGIIGCLQYFLGIEWIRQVYPPASMFGNKNMAAEFVCMVLTLMPGIFFCVQNRYLRVLTILSAIIALTFLFCSKCRAAWLATLVSFLISGIFLYREAFRPNSLVKLSRTILIKTGIATCMVILIIACIQPAFLVRFYTSVEGILIHPSYPNGESSISLRIKIWRNSFEMFKDRWVLGFGAGNFKVFYPHYHQKAVKDTTFSQRLHPKYAHNDMIQHAVEFGLTGAILFLGILFYPLRLGYQLAASRRISSESRMLVISVCGGITSFIVLSMFGFPCARALPPLLLFFYIGILMNIYLYENNGVSRYSTGKNRIVMIILCILVAVAGCLLTRFNIRNLISDQYYNFAQIMERVQNWNGAKEYGLKAQEFNPFNTEVLSTVGLAYAQTGQTTKAIESLKKVTNAYPYHMNPLINLAAAYMHSWDYAHAIETFERLRRVKPDHVKVLTDLGMLYTNTSDFDKALECLQEAALYAPLNPYIHVNLGSVLLKKHRYVEAAREYETVLTIDPDMLYVHKNLGLIYYNQLGQHNKALYHMQKYIEGHPSDKEAMMFRQLLDALENG